MPTTQMRPGSNIPMPSIKKLHRSIPEKLKIVSREVYIIGGPGKFDLMLALFKDETVKFSLDGGGVLFVKIDSISKKADGWIITGRTTEDNQQEFLREFQCWYTTNGNSGHLAIFANE